MIRLFMFIQLLTVVIKAQDYCNICGQGNYIQYPTGSVEFEYKGGKVKNNCKTLQEIVKNPNAISDSFCRNELLEYTHTVCRCVTADGTEVREIYQSPTASPAPAGPTTTTENKSTTSASVSIFTNKNAIIWWSIASALIVLFVLTVNQV